MHWLKHDNSFIINFEDNRDHRLRFAFKINNEQIRISFNISKARQKDNRIVAIVI